MGRALSTTAARAIPSSSGASSWPPCAAWAGMKGRGRCCKADRRSNARTCAAPTVSTLPKPWRRFAVKLEQSFEVEAPIDVVWQALIDVERVAPCLPGASVTGRNEDGSYAGNLTIKIGPTTAAYAGRLEMDQIDESAHVATTQAQGTDKRGQGGAKATITSTLTESGQATRVDVSTDYHITGRLARFGRGGMIEDISNRLLREFASCLQKSLAGQDGAAAEPAAGGEAGPGGGGAA